MPIISAYESERRVSDSRTIVLTADQALMTNFSGISFFDFGHCVPYRLVPEPFLKKVLGSPPETDGRGRARIATYPLRKVEAALLNAGFERKQVIVTTPNKIRRAITKDTCIVGLSVVDPLGKAPVTYTLASLLGGGDSCTKVEFLTLMKEVKTLKKKYNFKLIVGGQGVWQLSTVQKALGIDTLFFGEAEVTFPQLASSIINGEKTPSIVYGETPSVDEIPAIVNPSRLGAVQITRGCPRGCQFCSPATLEFRSMPLEKILEEIKVNVKNGLKHIDLRSDDILLYGANGIWVNHETVTKLFRTVIEKYNVPVTFPHVSIATVRQDPSLVKEISEIAGFDFRHPTFPDVGLESGSPRIIAKYMSGKPRPWTPQEWPETALEATRIMNENHWYPCYTMIVGFPDENEDDIVKTIELVSELRNMKAMAWTFPLLSIPISNTPLEKQGYPNLKAMPKAVWELFWISWQQSLWFSQKVRDQLLSELTNPLYREAANRLFDAGIESLNNFFAQMHEDPLTAFSEGMKLDFHSINGMITLARKLPKYLLQIAR
ncbi:MAG: radical SAM protein [Candidatus Bathyarchaeia archaeon]|jgi:radical SAM superfamily enzyme YgiQ (UPF0313 family)